MKHFVVVFLVSGLFSFLCLHRKQQTCRSKYGTGEGRLMYFQCFWHLGHFLWGIVLHCLSDRYIFVRSRKGESDVLLYVFRDVTASFPLSAAFRAFCRGCVKLLVFLPELSENSRLILCAAPNCTYRCSMWN